MRLDSLVEAAFVISGTALPALYHRPGASDLVAASYEAPLYSTALIQTFGKVSVLKPATDRGNYLQLSQHR